MYNLYLVSCGKICDSGHISFLVKAQSETKAIEIIKTKTFYNLGFSCEKVNIKNNDFYTVCNYDNPNYEG